MRKNECGLSSDRHSSSSRELKNYAKGFKMGQDVMKEKYGVMQVSWEAVPRISSKNRWSHLWTVESRRAGSADRDSKRRLQKRYRMDKPRNGFFARSRIPAISFYPVLLYVEQGKSSKQTDTWHLPDACKAIQPPTKQLWSWNFHICYGILKSRRITLWKAKGYYGCTRKKGHKGTRSTIEETSEIWPREPQRKGYEKKGEVGLKVTS